MDVRAAPPVPTSEDLARWAESDRRARPERLARLRVRLAAAGLDGYFGVRAENARYLTGFALRDGEEKGAGTSGWFLVFEDEVVLLADSRYAEQAAECPDVSLAEVYGDLPERWPDLVGGRTRIGVEAGFLSQALWNRLAAAAPSVELVPIEGWVEEDRATKEPSEIERIAAACAAADAALARLQPAIRPGLTEAELALDLEWQIRAGGHAGLAFDVACLAGPRASRPHGAPGDRPLEAGQVLLFDFGAQVGGYRSDMTRTLFVGEPGPLDLELYQAVAESQEAAFGALEEALARGERPSGRAIDALARAVIVAAGHGEHFGHSLGHGIGLATHEAPSLGPRAADEPLPGPTVFSIEPGIYLAGISGVRIEDLVLFDPAERRLERLTAFPREVTVVAS